MSGAQLPDAQALRRALWDAPLPDPGAPGREVLGAVAGGADYGAIRQALALLHRHGLPADAAARAAQERWRDSIDMARLALDHAKPGAQAQALARLDACVTSANRRRAVLAEAYLRQGQRDAGWRVLLAIDPASRTVIADTQRRVEWAVAAGNFARAEADLAWLEGRAEADGLAALRLWLCYRRDGAAAAVDQMTAGTPARILCTIFLSEGDLPRATEALARLHDEAEAARIAVRLALERGDGAAARTALAGRLAPEAPWQWDPADHLQWLRAGHLRADPPEALAAHAEAACRLWPRHDGLAYLMRLLREGTVDWARLANEPSPSIPARAMGEARAALRLGLPGRAARHLAVARRAAAPAEVAPLRADALLRAGRRNAAEHAARAAVAMAPDAVTRADAALQLAEAQLAARDPRAAMATLAPVARDFPDRLAGLLARARAAFQSGDFSRAAKFHAQFNACKATATGTDVRDRIVADAAHAAEACGMSFAHDRPVQDIIAEVGAARISASAGLSAWALMRMQADGAPGFTLAHDARIPRRIAHYWQGPHSPALPRARAAWAAQHAGFETRLFDAEMACDWLHRAHGAEIAKQFHKLEQPALRADLFRLCWMVSEGGVFADLDEFPRLPVTPWLAQARAVLCIEHGFGTIANNFLAAEPGHPVCTRALDYALAALAQTDAPYPWWHTGPAQWTRAALGSWLDGTARDGLRWLSQDEYCRRVSTNLPYPHKRGPDHWR